MIHYIYVGHFARQGDFIAFKKQTDGSLRPVVTSPLSPETMQQALQWQGLAAASPREEWGLWLEDGFIVCDRFTHSRETIELVRHLAAETGCDLADYSSQSLLSPKEVTFAWEPQAQSETANSHEHRIELVASADGCGSKVSA